ncbi:hypothetical protein [Roseibium algae]|uniref:Uncharacterized protein n=1 Tax=Roseibium algae TaxID=3123038 RepID=A0ABU8TPR4_9HYPH
MTLSNALRFAIPTVFCAVMALVQTTATAQTSPINDLPSAFNPESNTSMAITGPIIASQSLLIFGNGTQMKLRLLGETTGAWGVSGQSLPAQIFSIGSNPGELMNGNTLCGPEGAPTYLVVFQFKSYGMWSLNLGVFNGSQPPVSMNDDGLCGTYGFIMDDPS